MKFKFLLFFVPIIGLGLMYKQSQKKTLEHDFQRKYIKSNSLKIAQTISNLLVDGLFLDDSLLWVNSRSKIIAIDKGGKIFKNIPAKKGENNPIVNFYINQDSLYFYQGNSSTVSISSIKNNALQYNSVKDIRFNFPIIDFAKSSNLLVFLALQNNASFLVKSADLSGKNIQEFSTSFGNVEGGDMIYSGKLISSFGKTLFIPFYTDSVVIFNNNELKTSYAPFIDRVNQKVEYNLNGDRYTLKKGVQILRIGASIVKDYLFVSSFVKSKNESMEAFRKNTTIDVYDSNTFSYLFSFQIPNYHNLRIGDFSISSNMQLAAKYNDTVVIYDIKDLLNNNQDAQ